MDAFCLTVQLSSYARARPRQRERMEELSLWSFGTGEMCEISEIGIAATRNWLVVTGTMEFYDFPHIVVTGTMEFYDFPIMLGMSSSKLTKYTTNQKMMHFMGFWLIKMAGFMGPHII